MFFCIVLCILITRRMQGIVGRAWASWEHSIAVIMQCSGQRVLCIGSATWQIMESLDAVHMLAKTSRSDLTVRWSARHHSETHTVMSMSSIPMPSELDHRQLLIMLRDCKIDVLKYSFTDCMHQKPMRTLSCTLYSISQQNESLQAAYQAMFARVCK